MIAAEAVAVVLLAAGRSRRFGTADKLAVPLDGLPIGLHAARMLAGFPFAARIAVVRRGGPSFAAFGFDAVANDDPDAGQARSLALGVGRARRSNPRAILVALADMPFVTAGHVAALLARFDDATPVVASACATRRCPPALFGAAWFDALERRTGDAGARDLLRAAATVIAPEADLRDIDTPADLAGAQAASPR